MRNMEDTYIKAYRKLLDWRWADNPFMLALWVRLLLKANFEDNEWHNITIKRGQVVTSINNLSIESGLTTKQVRNCLERLKKTGEIELEGANKYSIITICNYDSYQSNEAQEWQTNGKQGANDGQGEGKQRATTKEREERKEGEEDIEKEKIKKEKVVFVPDQDDEWDTLLVEWLEYKRQRKESYKSQMSIDKCKTHLKNLAGNDLAKAREILDYSMASNYAGLFLPKDNQSTNPSVNPNIKDGRLLNSYKGMIADDPKIADRMGYPPLPYDDIVDGVKKTIYIYQH